MASQSFSCFFRFDFKLDIPCMAAQLKKRYEGNVQSEDLSSLAKAIDPIRVDAIEANGKTYKASYFGRQDLTGFKDYAYREYWRLEDAYNDLMKNKRKSDVLPYDNYPMIIEEGQVFVIDYIKTDSSAERKYYRADGEVWDNKPVTVEIAVD